MKKKLRREKIPTVQEKVLVSVTASSGYIVAYDEPPADPPPPGGGE